MNVTSQRAPRSWRLPAKGGFKQRKCQRGWVLEEVSVSDLKHSWCPAVPYTYWTHALAYSMLLTVDWRRTRSRELWMRLAMRVLSFSLPCLHPASTLGYRWQCSEHALGECPCACHSYLKFQMIRMSLIFKNRVSQDSFVNRTWPQRLRALAQSPLYWTWWSRWV